MRVRNNVESERGRVKGVNLLVDDFNVSKLFLRTSKIEERSRWWFYSLWKSLFKPTSIL